MGTFWVLYDACHFCFLHAGKFPAGMLLTATNVYGLFLAGVYITPLIGGWLADNVLGYGKTILDRCNCNGNWLCNDGSSYELPHFNYISLYLLSLLETVYLKQIYPCLLEIFMLIHRDHLKMQDIIFFIWE